MRYYIIAGEASGDLHGSNLIREMKKLDTDAVIRCWGGDKMKEQGAELVKHYRELAFMGFIEVLMNIRTIFRNLSLCKKDISEFKPDAVILIDYPGFNLRIAEWAKDNGLKVIYYISPQVWAWKANRVKKMKEHIDKMLCILPFEKDYYHNKWNWEVEYVGHPLVEVVEEFRSKNTANVNTNVQIPVNNIALLPGSRKQEILKKLPIMLDATKHFPEYHFTVAKAPGLDNDFYNDLLKPYPNVSWVSGRTYELLMSSKAALVTSGTATLETALFGIPEVVCYKGSPISYEIAKRVIKVKYISLVNLIMNKEVVKELIQNDLTVENLTKELRHLLTSEKRMSQVQEDYKKLKDFLTMGGNASANAASAVINYLR